MIAKLSSTAKLVEPVSMRIAVNISFRSFRKIFYLFSRFSSDLTLRPPLKMITLNGLYYNICFFNDFSAIYLVTPTVVDSVVVAVVVLISMTIL